MAWTRGPNCPIPAISARFSIRRNMRPGRACGIRTTRDISGCAWPRVLGRLPYGAKSEPVEEFAFEEETDGHTGDKYGWMNAAYAMAVNVNRPSRSSDGAHGSAASSPAAKSSTCDPHLPTDDGGVDLKCPTEIAISDRREHELAKSGLIPLIHRKNTTRRPSSARSRSTSRRSISATRVSTRPHPTICRHVFPTCSRSRALRITEMHGARQDRVHEGKDELTVWLQTWINEYVDANPALSSEARKRASHWPRKS